MTRRALLASPLLLAAQAKTQLIVIGDDIGAVHAIGEGTILAYQKGIMRSANLLVPGPWLLEAAAQLKANPGLDCGIHLALTSEWDSVKWRPLTPMPSLTDANGFFPPKSSFVAAPTVNLGEVESEIRAQIEVGKRHVPSASWLSTHMGAAVASPRLKELTLKLSAEYKMPMQDSVPGMKRLKVPYTKDSTREQRVAGMVRLIEGLEPGIWGMVDHPATDTAEMRRVGHVGYENVAEDRAAILHAWTHPEVLAAVQRRKVELTSVGAALLQKG
jgi:chitin disaccharide deacetylase